MNTLTQPRCLDGPIGTADVGSLPLKDMGGTQQNMTNIIDIVNVTLPPGGLDREAVKKLLAEKKYADLPDKMGPKTEVPYGYSMQLVVLQGPAPLDGAGEKSATLVKHYFLTVPGAEKQKWRAAQVKKFTHGSPKLIDWGNGTSGGDGKDRRKAFEYILEQLGGFQCRWFEVAAANGDGGEANVDALKIRWYPAIYAPFLGSLVQEGDITQLVPKGERDVAILEEPEHLNW